MSEVDWVLCLGDVLGYYCQVNETMDWVREHVDVCIMGNHDAFVLGECPANLPPAVVFGVEYAAENLETDHRNWLGKQPLVWGGILADKQVLLSHGSPWKPLDDYLYSDNPKLEGLRHFDFDIIAFGQTHRHLLHKFEKQLLLNPGSVGQSRDEKTRGCASAAIVDLKDLSARQIVEPYDTTPVVARAKEQGAHDWIEKFM
ncbi:MAG: metallophosphoesterase family protein [Synoicihabitans sp.]